MALQEFISSFSNVEVARPSRFLVDINLNNFNIIALYKGQVTGGVKYRCENAELPGRTFGTVEQKFGSNPSMKYPMHSSYTDISLSFLVSSDMAEKTFFDVWMEYINPSMTFDFGYKDDYVATIKIDQYDVEDNIAYSVNLINAYPIAVNQLDLDWSSEGVHKLVVVFAYDYWQMNGIAALNDSGNLPSSGVSSNDFGNPLTEALPQPIPAQPSPPQPNGSSPMKSPANLKAIGGYVPSPQGPVKVGRGGSVPNDITTIPTRGGPMLKTR